MLISKRVKELEPSGIRKFFDLVLGMKEVISLGVGEPDFITPWNIREVGISAIEEGFTSYSSNKGLYKLRLGISRYLKNRLNLHYDPQQEILITTGVSEGLDLALRAIINPKDKVLIPQPAYVSYGPVTSLSGGEPVFIKTQEETGFKLTAQLLERALNPVRKTRTKGKKGRISNGVKAVILNYPNNPTGVSYNKRELQQLKEIILKYKLICISDEIYGNLTYDFSHTPFAALGGARDSTVYLNGFSKSYAMTGWRLGYACGPREIISAMTKIHQYTMLCAPIISQMAASEALAGSRIAIEKMKREYKRRREFVFTALGRMGLMPVKPNGAFYFFVPVKSSGLSGIAFAQRLLEEEKVAVVPGTAFGRDFVDYIRISYCASLDNLKQALARIERFLKHV